MPTSPVPLCEPLTLTTDRRLRLGADYRGRAMVVYGHTPVPEEEWLNRTICIDSGRYRDSERAGAARWSALTAAGGEGMVVKPLSWLARASRGLGQPAIKCRGREHLRIIYGPEYTLPEHLDRLRARNVKAKRSLALREYALGLEALHRFVEWDPLYRVHECVFAQRT